MTSLGSSNLHEVSIILLQLQLTGGPIVSYIKNLR